MEYHVFVDENAMNIVKVSMRMACYKDIQPMGAKAWVDETFKGLVANTPSKGFDLTLEIDLDKPPADKAKLIENVASLKRGIMGAPFKRCFDALLADASANIRPMVIKYRTNEAMYIVPSKDRINVYFSVDFEDETDRAIAFVFLQEFAEAPRRINNTPNCSFSKEPPNDVKSTPGFKAPPNCVGYLAFQVFPRHLGGSKLDTACTLFQGFRSYLHYHIKASKSHLHSRMRARVVMLLQILNRANPTDATAEKATGRRNTQMGAAGKRRF